VEIEKSTIVLGGMFMEEKKTDFLGWVKRHKKQLILTSVSISVVVGIILGAKNKEVLEKLWTMLKRSTSNKSQPEFIARSITEPVTHTVLPECDVLTPPRNYTLPQEPVDVCMHIRTLTGGRVHSVEKAAEAEALGIFLLPNQTLVDSYTKYAA